MNDASRGFLKLVKKNFRDIGLVPLAGDEAFQIKRETAILLTHIDDFIVGCTIEFLGDTHEHFNF